MPSINANSWFPEQVQKDQARLRAYVRSLGVRAEWVDDLAQEALLIALRRVDEFDRTGDFGGWVRQIARRLIANERRKRCVATSSCPTMPRTSSWKFMASHPSRASSKNVRKKSRSCVSAYPGSRSGVVSFATTLLEDLSPGAIGSRLGLPSNQIRQTLLRLRRVLLTCMERRSGTHIA